MEELRRQIAEKQREAGTRVIWPPHALGFLDTSLPAFKDSAPRPPVVVEKSAQAVVAAQ